MKLIPLTQGQFAQVDDDDFERLNQFKWAAFKTGKKIYATRSKKVNGKKEYYYMHRIVMEAKNGDRIDHRDNKGLNNQRDNLRFCTHAQNLMNRAKPVSKSTSKFKGVCWDKSRNKWIACIKFNYKLFHLGRYNNEAEAAEAYNKASLKYHGEFANLNQITKNV